MGMPAGVCAITLSLLRRAWTTSARPELAEGRIRPGGTLTPPWLPHLCSILLSLGLRWVGRGSPAPFRPLPFFPAMNIKEDGQNLERLFLSAFAVGTRWYTKVFAGPMFC